MKWLRLGLMTIPLLVQSLPSACKAEACLLSLMHVMSIHCSTSLTLRKAPSRMQGQNGNYLRSDLVLGLLPYPHPLGSMLLHQLRLLLQRPAKLIRNSVNQKAVQTQRMVAPTRTAEQVAAG